MPAGGGTVVTLGDSITDGRGSTTNGNDRRPDDLARRFAADPATEMLCVANAGIGGNRLLAHPDRLNPRFDSGDHLHPSPAGYRAMADAVPLEFFAHACGTASCAAGAGDGARPTGSAPAAAAASALSFTPLNSSGIYSRGEEAGWTDRT